MSNKRKAGNALISSSHTFVPKSILSYLCGALNTDFASTRELIRRENPFIDEGHPDAEEFLDQIIEELFRYLYLISDCSENNEIQLSPSTSVDKVFHSLLMDPVLYHRICDAILNLKGGSNTRARDTRYQNTLVQYVSKFNDSPPENIWPQNLVPPASPKHSSIVSHGMDAASHSSPNANKHVSFRTGIDEETDNIADINGGDDADDEEETETDQENAFQVNDESYKAENFAPFVEPPEDEPKMTINIKTMTGAVSETILNVMHRINMLEDTPIAQQRILFNGQQTNPSELLSTYGIHDNDTLNLVLRHTGTFA